MEQAKLTTADEINADEWEPITTVSTGRTYAIRRVWPMELAMNGLLALAGVDELEGMRDRIQSGKQLSPEEIENINQFKSALICLGVVSHVVVNRPRGECPPGTISIDALRADREELFLAIRQKAHFGDATDGPVSDEPRKGESFRGEESPEAAAAPVAGEPAAH